MIVASIVAKKSRVTIWLCAAHAEARRRELRIGWIGLGLVALSFIALLFGGAVVPSATTEVFAVVEMLLIVGGTVLGFYGYYRSRLVRASRIDDRYMWLRGVTPLLRSSLPPLAG